MLTDLIKDLRDCLNSLDVDRLLLNDALMPKVKAYLESIYPDWDEEKLIYRK